MKTIVFISQFVILSITVSCRNPDTVPSQFAQTELGDATLSKSVSGPILYSFSGNANDESGHNHHGIVNGATLVADRFGNPNSAYSFNGVSSFIDIGVGRLLNPTTSLSISVWIKYNGGYGYRDIVSRWDVYDGVDERTYAVDVDPGNRLGFIISPDGSHANAQRILDPASLSVSGGWLHVVATWDGVTMRLFKNGVQVAKSLVVGMRRSPNNRTGIGAIPGRNGDPAFAFFNGLIDGVRVYNRALSPSEIQTLYREE